MEKSSAKEGFLWIIFAKFIRIFFVYISLYYVGRYLGPKDFGQLNFFISLFTLGIPVGTLALEGLFLTVLAKKEYPPHEILATFFLLQFISAFLTNLAITLFYFYSYENPIMGVLWVSIGLFCQELITFDYYYRYLIRFKYIIWVQFFALIISFSFRLYCVFSQKPFHYFLVAFAIEFILTFIGTLLLAYYQNMFSKWKINYSLMKKVLPLCFPFIVVGLSSVLNFKFDQLMIEHYLDLTQLGFYSAAIRISEFWHFLPTAFNMVFYPLATRSYYLDKQTYYHQLELALFLFFWGHFFLGIFHIFWGKSFISLLFGSHYTLASPVLSLHIFTGIPIALNMFLFGKCILEQKTSRYSICVVLSFIVNVLLNLLFIPWWGIFGAALASLISYSTPLLLCYFIDKKTQLFFFRAIFFPHNLKLGKIHEYLSFN